MNRQGPAHQAMRLGFPPATTTAGRSSLANGKLGGWTGVAPPGVPNPASRSNPGLTFSQSVGGGLSQPSTPLDMNEFPALGGQPQSNPAQAWNRTNTQSPSSQNRGNTPQQHSSQNTINQHAQPSHDNFSAAGHQDIFSAMGEYRRDGHLGVSGGGGGGGNQQSGGSVDDFPALPRTEGTLEARSVGNPGTQRQGISRLLPPLEGGMMPPPGVMQMGDAEKKNLLKGNPQPMVANGAPGLSNNIQSNLNQPIGSQLSHPSPAPGLTRPGQQHTVQQPSHKPSVNSNGSNFPDNVGVGAERPGTTEDERFGLQSLINALKNDSGEGGSLATGQDLTMLGLDLSQPDAPLWPSFASPFAELETKSVEPDFELPQCYTVHNTQPVHTKIQSFSDETLFYIFYTMPRDIMQEVVVAELAARNWRYHMLHRLWMTKDNTHVDQISDTAEKGLYVFFDPTTWERIRKEIVLEYSHLDPRTTGTYLGLNSSLGGAGIGGSL